MFSLGVNQSVICDHDFMKAIYIYVLWFVTVVVIPQVAATFDIKFLFLFALMASTAGATYLFRRPDKLVIRLLYATASIIFAVATIFSSMAL